MRRSRRFIGGAVAALAIVAVAGCSSSSSNDSNKATTTSASGGVTVPSTSGTTVNIVLGDTKGTNGPMTLKADVSTAKAGAITFTAKNEGTIKHEFIVLSGSSADLKPNADGEVSEANNVGEIGDVEVGKTGTATLTLKAGNYVLACNIKDHYKLGMYTDFTVTA